MMNITPKPVKHNKVDVTQKLHDTFILKFLCVHSVLFWIALLLLYLILFYWIVYLMFPSEKFI